MNDVMTLQGRQLTRADIDFVRQLITEHPAWSRRQLSIALSTALILLVQLWLKTAGTVPRCEVDPIDWTAWQRS